MYVEVRTTEEFYQIVETAYSKLLAEYVPDTLEVALAPGHYTRLALSLVDRNERGHVGIIVRAADPQQQPVLKELGIRLVGRDVSLENVIINHTIASDSLLTIRVFGLARVQGCAFISSSPTGWPAHKPLLSISGSDRGAQSATIQDCWLVGNREQVTSPMIDLGSLPGHRFEQIRFENVAFIGNHFTSGIIPGAADQVVFSRCLIYTPPNFLHLTDPRTEVVFEDCAILASGLDELVSFADEPSRTPKSYPPVVFKNCDLHLDSEPGADRRFERQKSRAFPLMPLDEAEITNQYARQAGQGSTPDIGTLRQELGLRR